MSSKTIGVRRAKLELEFALVKGDRERIAEELWSNLLMSFCGKRLDQQLGSAHSVMKDVGRTPDIVYKTDRLSCQKSH